MTRKVFCAHTTVLFKFLYSDFVYHKTLLQRNTHPFMNVWMRYLLYPIYQALSPPHIPADDKTVTLLKT